jgi:cephalosporin-C deacetylase-like acetyl esterase
MSELPSDFGMSAVETFAHVGDPSPAPDHSVFWNAWFERLGQESPVLSKRLEEDSSDPSATHEFVSTHGVRVGCRLITPPKDVPVRASLVTVHGYSVPESLEHEDRRWEDVCNKGVAVLAIRLRGFPGSRTNARGSIIELDASDRDWITTGFDSYEHKDWVLPDALGDVCNAVRVMRNALLGRDARDLEPWLEGEPRHPDIYLHGRSLGGGLATIASAQLSGRMLGRPIVDRLALEVPSLGAWNWRMLHSNAGLSARFQSILGANPDRHEELMNRLRLMDAVVHGRKVRGPTLAMLARRDDVAPAPSAAAVFNAVDSDPGYKWRFCVPCGHVEGDVATNRRIAVFRKVLQDFFDPDVHPLDSMQDWEAEMCGRSD